MGTRTRERRQRELRTASPEQSNPTIDPSGFESTGTVHTGPSQVRYQFDQILVTPGPDSAASKNGSQKETLQAAKQKAESEKTTPVSPEVQLGIERDSSGRPLDDVTREEMEASIGRDFSDVRVHTGYKADRLARGIGANAFAQGRDIFFSSERDPFNQSGWTTLAHELTHVAEGQTSPGCVQKDDAPQNLPAPPAEPQYSLTLTDGEHPNLSKTAAIQLLSGVYSDLTRKVDQYRGEWAEVNKSRTTFFGAIGGALTDLAGQNFPNYNELWAPVDSATDAAKGSLRAQDVQGAANKLKDADAEYHKALDKWGSYKNQLDKAGTKAEIGIAVVAVVAVAVIATGGAIAAPAAAASGGGTVVVGGGVGGTAALGATIPGDVAAAGAAPTVMASGGAAALAPTVAVDAAAAGGAGSAGAAGAATLPGVGGVTADAIVTAAYQDSMAALSSGGPQAVTAFAEAQSVGWLEAIYARMAVMLAANVPLMPGESEAVDKLRQVAPIIFEVWKRKAGFGGAP